LTHRHIKPETNLIGKHCEDREFNVSVTAPSLDLSFTLNTPLLSAEDADGSAVIRVRVDELHALPRAIIRSTKSTRLITLWRFPFQVVA
jgi:hypothetical protein